MPEITALPSSHQNLCGQIDDRNQDDWVEGKVKRVEIEGHGSRSDRTAILYHRTENVATPSMRPAGQPVRLARDNPVYHVL